MIEDAPFAKLFEFLRAADGLKRTYRAAYLSDESRHESSAEHIWHCCLYAITLHRQLGPASDLGRILELLVVHDLVEVFAGDAALHDEESRALKHDKEAEAAERLFGLLPDGVAATMWECWREFEEKQTAESRFANEIDRIQAISQNIFAAGRTWADYKVTEEVARRRNLDAIGFEPDLRPLLERLFSIARERGLWYVPNKSEDGAGDQGLA